MLQLNSDEEVGSPSSRPLTEKNARRSQAVLVLEPGTGLEGKLKTARKGVGEYSTVTVRGRASHAGVDFAAGASAILELARQIDGIAGFTRLERGITVNPGVISGGTRSNVVAAEARAEMDIRVPRCGTRPRWKRSFARCKPFDRRCTIEVTRRVEPAAHGALARHRAAVPDGPGAGAGTGSGTGGILHAAAVRTAISPPRSACRRWTAWAPWAKARTRQRKHSGGPHRRPHGADRQAAGGHVQ